MGYKRGELRLRPRQMGIALANIEEGKFGWGLFEKPTEIGSGQYHEFEIKAIEYVRLRHEIWVVDSNNGVTEHTPQELRSEDVAGIPYRITDEAPLPVTMGKHGVTYIDSVLITAANATELIAAPVSGYKLRIHYVSFSNKHTAVIDAALSEKTDGTELKFRTVLAPEGGNTDKNLTDSNWDLTVVTALQYYPQAAYAGGVVVNIGYSTVKVAS